MIILDPYQPAEAYPSLDYSVSMDGTQYRVALSYHERQDRWYLDLYDSDDTALLTGKMLAPDVALLADYEIAGMPAGQIFLLDTGGTGEPCGYADLGWRHLLVYVPEAELPSAAADPYDVEIAVVP
jgi:hypothetical protein